MCKNYSVLVIHEEDTMCTCSYCDSEWHSSNECPKKPEGEDDTDEDIPEIKDLRKVESINRCG